MLLFLAACLPKPPIATVALPPTFDTSEPDARDPFVPTDGDCVRAWPMQPGDTVECHGVLAPNWMMHEIRGDKADLVFWEDAARDCRAYRESDRALCDGTVAVLEQSQGALVREVKALRREVAVAGPLGFVAGAVVTVLVVYGVTEAGR